MQTVDIEKYLYFVTRPGRYTNNELNTKKKQVSEKYFNIALCFPDLYEVGMSHLGLKILYTILNAQDTLAADRVYAPDHDLIELLREKSIPLFSIEDKVPLKNFDVVGFTLQYELSCTNILLMLELGQIPILSENRIQEDPIIIAGGPGAFNPEPLSLFIDAFVIGDGEDVILEIAELLRAYKSKTREEILYLLTQIEGVYVPRFYEQVKDENGTSIRPTRNDVPQTIKRRFFKDFNNPDKMHSPQLMPIIDIVHRRPAFEVMRGCSRGCRFCQAGMIYRPIRERDSSLIEKQIYRDIETNGWEEISLNSLSTSDYSSIQPLLSSLMHVLPKSNITISLPSLRIDTFEDNFQPQLRKILGNTITLAPEAGSQRLRDSINKNISEQEILTSVQCALNMGIRSIKLYFMVGLPGETEEDIEEIITLIEKMYAINPKKISKINVSIAPFVPKAHTPFQWCRQDTVEEFLYKISLVKHYFSNRKKISIKYHTLEQSKLEAVIARGDRDISNVIFTAYKDGALFDSWNNSFDYIVWEQAAEKNNVDFNTYRCEIPSNSLLPWDHIDSCIRKDFLIEEFNKSMHYLITEDCRTGVCSQCGVCENMSPTFSTEEREESVSSQNKEINTESDECRIFYKIIYEKGDKLRFISHKELSALIYTILRKSTLPIYYTKGFNRHPKISFCPPLSLGMTGKRESITFSMTKKMDEQLIRKKLDVNLPKDFVIKEVITIDSSKKMNYTEELIRITSPDNSIDWKKIDEFQDIFFYSERKNNEIYLNNFFLEVTMLANGVDILKKLGLNMFEILEKAFHYSQMQIGTCHIERIELY
ncbi:MAG: TIGR03960 family B12-binding radical SAM protein [Candidatus Cloacimonetes bacterium]|nr:TIGR03960 family B12-binding radical SAM protein [Candidatus Cloacimonadota bacterium]